MFIVRNLKVSSQRNQRLIYKFYHAGASKLRLCADHTVFRLQFHALPPNIIASRYRFCTKSDDYDPEIDILDEIETKNELITLISPKLILYPNAEEDRIITDLSNAQNETELCRVILQNRDNFDHRHVVQSILMRWELVVAENRDQIGEGRYLESTEFQWILNEIPNHLQSMNSDELTCCLLYLNKLGVHIKSSCLQNVITECLQRINNSEEFPLTAMSRFTVALHSVQADIYMYLVCKDLLPKVLQQLNMCDNEEDFRLITICLNNVHKLIGIDSLNLYTSKVIELMEKGILNKDSSRLSLKIIHFLNYPHWSQNNLQIIRRLCLMIEGSIPEFQTRDLIALFKVLQSHIEPASLIPAITNHAQYLLKTTQSVELLTCSVLYSLPPKRIELTEVAKSILHSINLQPTQLAAMFKVLRLLKISNLNLINSYWDKVVVDIKSNPEQRESHRIAQNCHRYMHFNNNLGGTYRHIDFERVMSSIIMDELKSGLSFHIPTKFIKLAAFVFAYGMAENDKFASYPDFMLAKIEEIKDQLAILDCLQLSRGLQIAYELRFRRFIPKIIAAQMARVENVLNSCTERHIEQENLTLPDLNSIVRSFNNRKSSRTTYLFNKIITKYDQFIDAKLTSRLIRDITFNLIASNHRNDRIMEKLLDYIHENREYVTGDTVEKVVYCCFNLGYVPENFEALNSSIVIINRDFNYMSGLSIIQACLALSYFKVLPENLINRVFNIDFIQRLEDEITMCYSKATYPERVLNQVMQLNRAVCLDYPETRVPWFQQNYIEAQLSKQPKISTAFHVDVKKFLDAILPGSDMLKCDLVTPYGYRIDFALFLDKNKNFVPSPAPKRQENSIIQSSLKKIAILLPRLESLCENNPDYFHGTEYLKQRHLEILGFKVIHINYNTWYSMYMNIPNAKLNYLKNLLEIEN